MRSVIQEAHTVGYPQSRAQRHTALSVSVVTLNLNDLPRMRNKGNIDTGQGFIQEFLPDGGGGGGGGERGDDGWGSHFPPHSHIYLLLSGKNPGGSKSGEISRGPPPLYKILLVIIIPTTYKLGINLLCVCMCCRCPSEGCLAAFPTPNDLRRHQKTHEGQSSASTCIYM